MLKTFKPIPRSQCGPYYRGLLHLKRTKISIVTCYYAFASFIILMTIISSCWTAYSSYQATLEERNFKIEKEGLRLNFELLSLFSIVENTLFNIGDKIINSRHVSYKDIAEHLKRYNKILRYNIFSWDMIEFIDPSYILIANSIDGLVRPYINLENLDWMKIARHSPFKLHFGPPIMHIKTKERIISSALGIRGNNNEFLGYISTPISINKVRNSMIKHINNGTNFIILDDDLNFITSSDDQILEKELRITNDLKKNIRHKKWIEPKMLTNPVSIGNTQYISYICSERYPFVFLVGQSNEVYYHNLTKNIMPHIFRNICFNALFLLILMLFAYKIANSISSLTIFAESISVGRKINIPRYMIHELNILVKQLININKIHRELNRHQVKLIKANKDFKKANEFIKSNVSFLTHELKNPISAIVGYCEILLTNDKERFVTDLYDIIDKINSAAKYQNRQINFFLELFKFQEHGKILEQKTITLKELININVNMIMHHAIENNVTIQIDIPDTLPNILGDPIMLSQMIQNLTANAAKYNKQNGKVTVKAFTKNDNTEDMVLVLQIRDTGIGIAQENLEAIFEKFNRIANSQTQKKWGYGIGLSYVQYCASLHDAKIIVKSKIGYGSEFSIVFPKFRILSKKDEIDQLKISA